ncbi:MAG: hypothetical protein OXG44_11885 [Gammaproteobacteria bacterium]|nr:hypothetical protein [Gammaproteobacteria bacterium]
MKTWNSVWGIVKHPVQFASTATALWAIFADHLNMPDGVHSVVTACLAGLTMLVGANTDRHSLR